MRRSSLDAVIPVLRQLILAELLVRSEDEALYRGELARRLGVSASSLQRPLRALEATGILRTRRRGRQLLYEPERSNPLLPELSGLLRKTRGLLDVLRDGLAAYERRILVAFVFGSMASGAERPGSDVDLLVIGDVTLRQLSPGLREAERVLGRDVHTVVYPVDELRSRIQSKNHFVRNVLDKPRLFVVGTEDDLAGVVEGRPRRASPNESAGARRTSRRRPAQSG